MAKLKAPGRRRKVEDDRRTKRHAVVLRPVVVGSIGPVRRAFTLTELLVAMTIMIILTVMTLSAYNYTMSGEQIRSAARQVQSFLEGARDRAIYAHEPRGVRLLVDRDFPTLVTAMVYVGESDPWTQGVIRLERPDDNNDGVADSQDVRVMRGWNTDWFVLKQKGLLFNGLRVKIPRGKDGSWYTINTNRLTATNEELRLTIPYRDPGTSEITEVVAFEGGGPNTYQIELPAVVLPGADGEPRLLPSSIVIDLNENLTIPNSNSSQIPRVWLVGSSSSPAFPTRANADPVYSSRMDIMFSPRGTVIGDAAGTGIIHLLLNSLVDATKEGPLRKGLFPADPDNLANASGHFNDLNGNGVIDEDEQNQGEKLITTLFCRTGQISTHPLFTTEDINQNGVLDAGEDANGNGTLDGNGSDLFFFAETGEVAAQ